MSGSNSTRSWDPPSPGLLLGLGAEARWGAYLGGMLQDGEQPFLDPPEQLQARVQAVGPQEAQGRGQVSALQQQLLCRRQAQGLHPLPSLRPLRQQTLLYTHPFPNTPGPVLDTHSPEAYTLVVGTDHPIP